MELTLVVQEDVERADGAILELGDVHSVDDGRRAAPSAEQEELQTLSAGLAVGSGRGNGRPGLARD
jgi:hypothetical protein